MYSFKSIFSFKTPDIFANISSISERKQSKDYENVANVTGILFLIKWNKKF